MDTFMEEREMGVGEPIDLGKIDQEKVILTHLPENFDITNYISQYSGRTRIDRLVFIAERCPSVQTECLTKALDEIKSLSFDYTRYQELSSALERASSNIAEQVVDHAWIKAASLQAREQLDKLESELKNYQNNLIKERIRISNNEIGDHLYKIGDLSRALKSFLRTRDYCTTTRQIADMCLNVIRVSIELGNFAHVQSYVMKAENLRSIDDEGVQKILLSKLKVASALASLHNGNYRQTARFLTEIAPELGCKYNEVISPSDITIYGGLCALITFDRSELLSRIIENPAFKQYLEYEPQIREAILAFYKSDYHTCLEIIEQQLKTLLLDPHFAQHVGYISREARQRCLIQYISPFASIDLRKMAEHFMPKNEIRNQALLERHTTLLEEDIANLIRKGKVQVRIDSQNKILHAREQDQRSSIFQKSLKMAYEYSQLQKNMLMKVQMTRANLVVETPKGNSHVNPDNEDMSLIAE